LNVKAWAGDAACAALLELAARAVSGAAAKLLDGGRPHAAMAATNAYSATCAGADDTTLIIDPRNCVLPACLAVDLPARDAQWRQSIKHSVSSTRAWPATRMVLAMA
jgi:hypothetical protein